MLEPVSALILALAGFCALVSALFASFAWHYARPTTVRAALEGVDAVKRAFPAWQTAMEALAQETARSADDAKEFNRKATNRANGERPKNPQELAPAPTRADELAMIEAQYRAT